MAVIKELTVTGGSYDASNATNAYNRNNKQVGNERHRNRRSSDVREER